MRPKALRQRAPQPDAIVCAPVIIFSREKAKSPSPNISRKGIKLKAD
jgi:hypothetical protein